MYSGLRGNSNDRLKVDKSRMEFFRKNWREINRKENYIISKGFDSFERRARFEEGNRRPVVVKLSIID